MPNVLITTPHSSSLVPDELRSRFRLTEKEVKDSCDVGTCEVASGCKLGDLIDVYDAEVSRLVVDLNRESDDLRPIGVCRERDFRRRPIYKHGENLTNEEKKLYIEKYHKPWHAKFSRKIAGNPLRFYLDLHNTNERIRYNNAYYPGERVKMEDITDFDIAHRSEFQKPDVAADTSGLTFPPGEISGVIESVRIHMGEFFEKYLKRDSGTLRVTCGEFMKGGPNIQKARDAANWENGTSRSLQFELQRQFFVDENGNADPVRVYGIARAIRNVIDDILKNTFKQ